MDISEVKKFNGKVVMITKFDGEVIEGYIRDIFSNGDLRFWFKGGGTSYIPAKDIKEIEVNKNED
ncbi:MAG TPA: hypothetical protein PLI22_05155 [Caldisericia bacterium]|nr:hypothetical protein [Caldisericia bacterium]